MGMIRPESVEPAAELRAEFDRLKAARDAAMKLHVEDQVEIARLRSLLVEMVADEADTLLGSYFADIEAALGRKP